MSVENANRYHAYMQGWRDGAQMRAKRDIHTMHRLLPDYLAGYDDGVIARGHASHEATARFGYEPSILRAQGEP